MEIDITTELYIKGRFDPKFIASRFPSNISTLEKTTLNEQFEKTLRQYYEKFHPSNQEPLKVRRNISVSGSINHSPDGKEEQDVLYYVEDQCFVGGTPVTNKRYYTGDKPTLEKDTNEGFLFR